MKKIKEHQCTKQEAEHIRRIIWKYFSHEFAEKVMIAYRKKPGNRFKAYDDFWHMDKEWSNSKKATKEINDYIRRRNIFGIDLMLTDEEIAILYDSGFVFRND